MRGITGRNNSDLTEMNRSAVVKILQQREVCSRADIAKETGLTQAAITKIVAELMRNGIVTEVGSMRGIGNRRSIGIKLNADKHQVIGVKVSRQMFAVGVFDIAGKIYKKVETEYSLKDDRQSVISAIKEQVHGMLKQYENVVAIGFAVPGPYLREEGYIAVVTQMPTWHDINFIDEFEDEFDRPVFIEHDANAGALAEWWFGNHEKKPHTLAYFLIGEGVGAGIIEVGNILWGAQGVASEIGHVSVDVDGPRCECGNYGCLELYCSSHALIERAEKKTAAVSGESKNSKLCNDIFASARLGDKDAMNAVEKTAEYIGYGCVMLINAYGPDTIVIGDILAQGGDLMMPIIEKVVKERTIPELHNKVKIKISDLEVDSTLYGAAAIATDKVLELPSAFSTSGKETMDLNLNEEVVM